MYKILQKMGQNRPKIDKNAIWGGAGVVLGRWSTPGGPREVSGIPPGNSKVDFLAQNVTQGPILGAILDFQGRQNDPRSAHVRPKGRKRSTTPNDSAPPVADPAPHDPQNHAKSNFY